MGVQAMKHAALLQEWSTKIAECRSSGMSVRAWCAEHVNAPLLPHSYASASVVTDIIVKKFADALPLYRQEQMWKRLGVDLKRNTMAHWVVLTAETYLKPFSDAFLRELLRQAVIHADETVLQVNKEPGREATAESRIWAYASSKRAGRQIRYFCYEESRKGACAEKVLSGYNGVVISDGYSGYNILSQATRAGCWAHARRKWVEAMPDGATKENTLAAKGLEYCSRLFEVEQKLESLPDADRRKQRQLLSKPIVDDYYAWLETIFRPAGKLKKAVTYSLNQREYLCAFLDHGEIEISNNQVENAMLLLADEHASLDPAGLLFCRSGGCMRGVVADDHLLSAARISAQQKRAIQPERPMWSIRLDGPLRRKAGGCWGNRRDDLGGNRDLI